MRVGIIRQDLASLHLDDIENTSQRNFSSQPPGQSRQIEYPSFNVLLSVLNQYAFLSNPGSGATFPLTLTGANNTLTAKASATGSVVTMTIATGAYSAAALATAINAAFAANSLLLVASVITGPQIQVDTVAPASPFVPSFATAYTMISPPLGRSVESPFVPPLNSGPTAYMLLGGSLATALGLGTSALTGLPVNSLASIGLGSPSGVYSNTGIAGQSGTAASIIAGPTAGVYTVTGLTGMTANSVLHRLFITGSGSSNNGTYQIVAYNSPTSVNIATPPGQALTVPDANNPAIHWNEDAVTFNISYTQIGTLSTFAHMEGYSATTPTGSFLALATGIQNAIAAQLIETGPVLLSFGLGKLSIMLASNFQPGLGVSSAYPYGEGAIQRLGYAAGPAVYITQDDGVTPYTI